MSKRRIFARITIGVVVVIALGLAFIFWYDSVGQHADPEFVARAAHPAYRDGTGPQLAFDAGHNNWHTASGRYKPLASLLTSDGFRVSERRSSIDAASLDSIRVFVIANAMGPDGHEGHPAFTEDEERALVAWVQRGGSLLLIADHVPFGAAAERLAKRFGITMYLAFARDDENHSGWDNEKLVFSRGNGLLTPCPITDGRVLAERIDRVVTFTGQSLSVPEGATPILRMGDGSYDWESRSVRRSAKGHAQAVAMPFGKGRLVVLGEAGLLSAQVDPLGIKMGMNTAGNDDKQFALNVAHWLAGTGGE